MRLSRLGHKRKDFDDNYSHVTDIMITRMLAGLQRRWEEDGGMDLGAGKRDVSGVNT